MIVSFLQGGIGNRLFQVAASVGASEFYGNTWMVQGDFPLEYFSIPPERVTNEYALPRYKEKAFHYEMIPHGNFQLQGYFQSYRYFKIADKTIREIFKPKVKITYPQSLEGREIAIHVRGKDYLQLKDVHYNLDQEYYWKAINMVGATPDNAVIFTDDYNHAENLLGKEWVILSGNWWEDFFMMQRFKIFIIANSSFSWWASYLADGRVIAPKTWFADKKKHFILHDLYLPEWTVI